MVSEKTIIKLSNNLKEFASLEENEKALVLSRIKELADNEESAEEKEKQKAKQKLAFQYLMEE